MARIFISYARDDGSEIADELADELRKHHHVFRDQDNIPGGANWETVLNNEVKNANIIVLLVTPASLKSNWIFKEFDAANKKGKLIIPVRLDDTPLLPYLGDRQAVQLRNGNVRGAAADINMAIGRPSGDGRSPGCRLLLALVLIVLILAAGVFLVARGGLTPANNTRGENTDGLNNAFVSTPTAFVPPITLAPTDTAQPSNTPLPTKTPIPPTPTPTLTNTPVPPTQTPTSPPGPLLLSENFDDYSLAQGIQTAGQWVFISDNSSVVYQLLDGSDGGQVSFGDEDWRNYAVEVDVRATNLAAFDSIYERVFIRIRVSNDEQQQITLALDYKSQSITLYKNDGTNLTELQTKPIDFLINYYEWITIHIEVKDQNVRVSLNDLPRMNLYIGSDITKGAIQIQSPNSFVQFDNIKVFPIN